MLESVYECIHACMSVHMYESVHAGVPNLLPCHCTHIWYHWTNMTATLQIWPTQPLCYMEIQNHHFCIYLPKHNHQQYLLHIITMYGPATNMPLNMSVEIPHINSVQSTMWPKVLLYIAYYWHVPLNKYACHTAHICTTTLPL